MRISDYVRPDLVLRGLPQEDGPGAIQRLVAYLGARTPDTDLTGLEQLLLTQEQRHPTSLPSGVAVPHTIFPGIDRPLVVIGVAPRGLAFGTDVNAPIEVVFLLLSPPGQAGLHIKLLARIARLANRSGLVRELVNAPSDEALLERLEQAEADHV